MAVVPFTLTPLGLLTCMDPFSYTFHKILNLCVSTDVGSNYTFVLNVTLLILRVLCTVICVTEACRFFSLFYCVAMYIFELEIRYVEHIYKLVYQYSNFGKGIHILKWYKSLQIAHQTLQSSFSLLVACILGDGFVIIVACNLATLRAYNLLPIEVYWLMPMVAVVTALFVAFVLSFAIKINERTSKSIRMKKSNENQKVRKQYAAIRPVVFSCRGLFHLKRGTESGYFYWVFLRTIDGILVQN